jgi:hypothetical protein
MSFLMARMIEVRHRQHSQPTEFDAVYARLIGFVSIVLPSWFNCRYLELGPSRIFRPVASQTLEVCYPYHSRLPVPTPPDNRVAFFA